MDNNFQPFVPRLVRIIILTICHRKRQISANMEGMFVQIENGGKVLIQQEIYLQNRHNKFKEKLTKYDGFDVTNHKHTQNAKQKVFN